MRRCRSSGGRAGFGAATVVALALVGCATEAPPTISGRLTATPTIAATAGLPPNTPTPSSPAAFALETIDRTFPSVVSLTSTGARLQWASEASIWRFAPGDPGPERVYQSPVDEAVVWDVAAAEDAYVFSERLAEPAGSWRVAYVEGDAPPVELERGVAERGAPPTLAIDDRRIAWAGFDESSGSPRSFLRVIDRANPDVPTTLLDLDIDDGLLWYPQLDRDTLWYSIIEPDFEGAGGGDASHIETMNMADPSAQRVRFEGGDNDFDAAVTVDYVVWKSVQPGLSALTWGSLHLLDRRSNERLVIAGQANHPTLGTRFVAFEEIAHEKVLLYDLATRSIVDLPDPMGGLNGTVGAPAISRNLLGYSVSVKGSNTIYWSILPAA